MILSMWNLRVPEMTTKLRGLVLQNRKQCNLTNNRRQIPWELPPAGTTQMDITYNSKKRNDDLINMLSFPTTLNKILGRNHPSLEERSINATWFEKPIFRQQYFKGKDIYIYISIEISTGWSVNNSCFLITKRLILPLPLLRNELDRLSLNIKKWSLITVPAHAHLHLFSFS